MCLGVERYMQGSLQEALDYFRRGFLLYQRDYHLNRYLYTCLIGLGQHKEAAEFVTKIYMGFKSVYWINYVLAMHHMVSIAANSELKAVRKRLDIPHQGNRVVYGRAGSQLRPFLREAAGTAGLFVPVPDQAEQVSHPGSVHHRA